MKYRHFSETTIPYDAEQFAELLPSMWEPAYTQLDTTFKYGEGKPECTVDGNSLLTPDEGGGAAAIWRIARDHGVKGTFRDVSNDTETIRIKDEISYNYGAAVIEPFRQGQDDLPDGHLVKIQTIESRLVANEPVERWVQARCGRLIMPQCTDMSSFDSSSLLRDMHDAETPISMYIVNGVWDAEANELKSYLEGQPFKKQRAVWERVTSEAEQDIMEEHGLRGLAYIDLVSGLERLGKISKAAARTLPPARPSRTQSFDY